MLQQTNWHTVLASSFSDKKRRWAVCSHLNITKLFNSPLHWQGGSNWIPYILTTSGLTTSRQCWGRQIWVNQVYKLTTLLYADKVFDNSFKFWSILMANERFLSSPSIFYYYQCCQKYIYTTKWFSGPNIAYHRQMKDFPAHQVSSFIINAVKEMSPQTLFRQMFFFKFRKYQGNPYSYCDDNGVFRK